MHLQNILCNPVENEREKREAGGNLARPKGTLIESPTQYYLNELGLNLEWQNGLLQFGQAVRRKSSTLIPLNVIDA